jgi:ribosome-binding factor A
MRKTRRTSKVGDLIRDILSEIIRRDESIQRDIGQPAGAAVGLTGVEVSPDLSFARVHVTGLGDEAEIARIVEVLKKHRPRLRSALGARAKLRVVPELDLRPDTTSISATAIETLLMEAKRRDAEIVHEEETAEGEEAREDS